MTSTTLNTNVEQTIPANGVETYGNQYETVGYTLRGTFEAIDNKTASELGAYVLQNDGNWHPVHTAHDKATILPFRAYLLPSIHNAEARIGMTLLDGTETEGIDSILTIDLDGTESIYDLNGRRINGNAKGIIIKNGKKIIRK